MPARSTVIALVVAFIGCAAASFAQDTAAPEAYLDADAYQVFSALLSESGAPGSTNTLVIEQETVPHLGRQAGTFSDGPEACIYPDVAIKFREAIADYNRVNQKRWLLQRSFEINGPYELVTADTLKTFFSHGDWDGFYKRYPSSGGFISLSAVGFNRDKTRAILYGGRACGSLCGQWSYELFEKVGGEWKTVPGVSCHTVS